MATIMENPERIALKTWRFRWTGTAPFNIFSFERFSYIKTNYTPTEIILYHESDVEPPALRVFDAFEGMPDFSALNPAELQAQWRGKRDALGGYVVRDLNVDVVATIPETGKGYYIFNGQVAEDGTVFEYTVNAIGYGTDESRPITQEFELITYPRPPIISASYDDVTGDITVEPA